MLPDQDEIEYVIFLSVERAICHHVAHYMQVH